jgi:hypothetical protein
MAGKSIVNSVLHSPNKVSAMTSPAQRLGLKVSEYQSCIDSFDHSQRLLRSDYPASHPDNAGHLSWINLARFSVMDAVMVSASTFLAGDWNTCRTWCRKTGQALEYYLLGDWTQKETHDDGTIDAKRWFEQEPCATWVQCFDMDFGWVAVGGHWDLVDRILQFPQPSIGDDGHGRASRAYYMGLAQWWADRTKIGWIDEVNQLRGAGSKGYHLLCDIVAGIVAADRTALQKAFPKYVQYFLKQRDHDEQFPMAATFLWNVAQREGIAPELADDTDMFLFRLPDEV